MKEWRNAPRAETESKKVTFDAGDSKLETVTQATDASIGRTDIKSKKLTSGVAG